MLKKGREKGRCFGQGTTKEKKSEDETIDLIETLKRSEYSVVK